MTRTTLLQRDTFDCFAADPEDLYLLPPANRRCAMLMCRRGWLRVVALGQIAGKACAWFALTPEGRDVLSEMGESE